MASRDELPPYAYVPGHRPHPTRHPRGHAYGRHDELPPPLQPDAGPHAWPNAWRASARYLEGLALFEHGYYWEAHEAWEGLWIAAGRTGAVGELLRGLILLAAAGVKIRQGRGAAAAKLGARARGCFERAEQHHGGPRLAGLGFAELLAFADYVRAEGPSLRGSPEPAVEVVFERRLSPSDDP